MTFFYKMFFVCISLSIIIGNVSAYTEKELMAAEKLASNWIIQTQETVDWYKLDETITRREVVKIIGKLSWNQIWEVCDWIFGDVKSNDWGCKYVEYLYKKGIVSFNAQFRPDDQITKTEVMKMILKIKNVEKIQETTNWQEDYMITALDKWIITEKYTDYNMNATRWWIFHIAAMVIQKEQEGWLYSDEAL